MTFRKAVGWLGAGFFLLSWFLPAYFDVDDVGPGWKAFWLSLGGMWFQTGRMVDALPFAVIMAISALTNVAMVIAISGFAGHVNGGRRWARFLVILGIANGLWLVPAATDLSVLGIGFYLWWLSFFLVAYGCTHAGVTRRVPVVAAS